MGAGRRVPLDVGDRGSGSTVGDGGRGSGFGVGEGGSVVYGRCRLSGIGLGGIVVLRVRELSKTSSNDFPHFCVIFSFFSKTKHPMDIFGKIFGKSWEILRQSWEILEHPMYIL